MTPVMASLRSLLIPVKFQTRKTEYIAADAALPSLAEIYMITNRAKANSGYILVGPMPSTVSGCFLKSE